jgi:ankyrin repeat protein
VSAVPADEPYVTAATDAIQAGDLEALTQILDEHPELPQARIARRNGNTLTLLHLATDWPGHFPNGPKAVALLVDAGADVNARTDGENKQTPLHWAASSNDVGVLDALLDAGADIEAPGAFDGVGGPLDNAVGFGQWAGARRLVERGARIKLWHAAALGLTDRIEEVFAEGTPPSREEVTEAFWQACHGGQQPAAAYLLDRGADLNWIGYNEATPLDMARSSNENAGAPTCNDEILSQLVEWLEAQGARSTSDAR